MGKTLQLGTLDGEPLMVDVGWLGGDLYQTPLAVTDSSP